MASVARGERTEEALIDETMANVLAQLAVPRFFSCFPNATPIAMVASVLHLVAYFLDLLFPCTGI